MPTADSAVDLALVRRAQAGDEQAFGQLVERNRRAVYRAAYAALGSAEDADDVAQETFVAVYQKLQGFRGEPPSGPGCWRSPGARRWTAAAASPGGCA